jgi:2-polyprenyl-6-methoxyphenol hydroxylase-like FAD-dependent oxidoreductase
MPAACEPGADTEHLPSSWDVIVVGARCGGAATALCLARRGLRVLVLDRGRYGSDTLSTHALMRPAVHQLQRWGILDRLWSSAPPVRATTFYYDGAATTVLIKPRGGVTALLAPRRTVLDAALVDAARRAGARVEHGCSVHELLRDASGRVLGLVAQRRGEAAREFRAPLVVGADGRHSTVARLVGALPYRLGLHRCATLYAYFAGVDDPAPEHVGYHWYFAPRVSASLIPTSDGLWCAAASVAASSPELRGAGDPAAALQRWIARASRDLAARLARARRVGKVHSFAGLLGSLRPCQGPGWALVGDAGLFRDPGTAHGISDAFRDAELLAAAVSEGGEAALQRYQAARDDLCSGVFDVTDAIAGFDWDMGGLAQLHQRLSAEMQRELASLPPADGPPNLQQC